uniref:Uncharacterized protein n=1 Tax=Amphimedon queenslandica TaxID=400682 RepID=A0A1X7U3M3_AMPQE
MQKQKQDKHNTEEERESKKQAP